MPLNFIAKIAITERCNLRCHHCYSTQTGVKEADLPLEVFKKVIDQVAALFGKDSQVNFTGGEPLLYPDFFEAVNYASRKGLRTILLTNGYLITEEVVSKLKQNGLTNISISLDGPKYFHDKLRNQEGAHKKAVNVLQIIRHHFSTPGINITLCQETLYFLDYLISVAKINNANLSFNCFVPVGRGKPRTNLVRGLTPISSEGYLKLKQFILESQMAHRTLLGPFGPLLLNNKTPPVLNGRGCLCGVKQCYLISVQSA